MRWTPSSRADLQEIFTYLAARNFDAAVGQEDRVVAATGQLFAHPYLGRSGRVAGTRELVVTGTPYIVVYRIEVGVIQVLRILRGAQDWPTS